jgi:hypothetical protein
MARTGLNLQEEKMLKRIVGNLAISGIAIASAIVLAALSATGASAAAMASARPGHLGVAANTVAQAGPAAPVNALAHVPATLAAPAHAAPVPHPRSAQVVAARFVNVHYGTCIGELAYTSQVGLSPCNTNHSEYWYYVPGAVTQIKNVHSGLCLSVDGTAETVGASPCNSNHAEFWYGIWGPGDLGFEVINDHTGLCLQGYGSHVYQAGSCGSFNHAFLWNNE